MRARRGHQAGVGRGGISVRRAAAAIAVVAAAALALTAGAVPASAAAGYTVIATIGTGPMGAIAVDPTAGTVYATYGDAVAVIDAATNTVTAAIPISVSGGAIGIAADSATHAVYVANIGSARCR